MQEHAAAGRVGSGGVARLSTLGARVRAARIALGAREGGLLSQTEFATRVADVLGTDLHQTRLSRIESDAAVPTVTEALALAVAADVSVMWLAYGVDVVAAVVPTDDALAELLEQQRAALSAASGTSGDDVFRDVTPPRGRARLTPPGVPTVQPTRGRRR